MPIHGRLCPGDQDYYRLLAQEGDTITATLSFSHAEGDLGLWLRDDSVCFNQGPTCWIPPEPLATSYSSTDVETLTYTVPEGEGGFYSVGVGVTSESFLWTIPDHEVDTAYQLMVSGFTGGGATCEDDEFEPNFTNDPPTPTTSGQVLSAQMCAGDVDNYEISVADGDSIRADLATSRATGSVTVALLDHNNGFSYSSDAEVGRPASTTLGPVPAGTYRVAVHGAETPYLLRVTAGQPCDDVREPNDIPAEAPSLMPGEQSSGWVCDGDEDWFAITVEEGDTLQADLSYTAAFGQLFLLAYGTDGTTLLSTIDWTSHDDEHVELESLPAGTYFLRVLTWPEVGNNYELTTTLLRSTCHRRPSDPPDQARRPASAPGGPGRAPPCPQQPVRR